MSVSTPSQGTHFSDGLRTGPIIGSTFIPGANVLTPSVMVSSPTDQLPPGVFNTPMSLLDIIPAPVNTASIAALQTSGAAGNLTLAAVNGIGITVITYSGIPNVLQLDCARNIMITGTVGVTSQTFTVYGWDQYGIPMAEQITGPTGAETVNGSKTFLYIQGVYVSASTVDNVSIGVGNTFGLPYLITSPNYAFTPYWNGFPDVTDSLEDDDLLVDDPITTVNGQSIVTLTLAGNTYDLVASNFVEGQWITIVGATAVGGITAPQLNITAQIASINVAANTISYQTNGVATSSVTAGGNAVAILFSNTVVTGDQRVATATTRDVRGTYTPSSATLPASMVNANGFNRLTINFYNSSGDGRNYNNASNGIVNLNANPITTVNGSTTVSIFAPNHQLTAGEKVTIAGAVTTNGLTSGQLNVTAPVTIFDQNNFTYIVTGAAAIGTGQGGGNIVTMSPRYGNLYQVATGRFGVSQYTDPTLQG